ncbi:hypothetical protein CXF72_05845 [Psychromonas sp. MB-3u-54]|uniref:hypothetical protein n=1 Tax=Psychromonas sp. MB-3u-54 TaxID=2058319 RepID=UPI000C337D1D|nr:hypothetical protein [Psychromonas sp. MB-3u-54]PKH03510.1 hypothetical protein CXF72_05845 [Psychromonas sp. MB-3u-54]
MKEIRLKQEERFSIKLTHQIDQGEFRRIDVYFSLPKEMSINKNTLPEIDYFNAGVRTRSAYFTQGLHLPLLHSRFASRMKHSAYEYRNHLNLFAYQYVTALDTDTKDALKINDSDKLQDFYNAAQEIANHSIVILGKTRAHAPKDPKLAAIFENVDNYLSWYTEQSLLGMLAKKPRVSEFSEDRLALLRLCKNENLYRQEKAYNSQASLDDPNRIANKMRLLRRLIEYGVIFKTETLALGNITRKVVTGVATALIMSVVLVLIIKTQGAFSTLTSLMVFILAIIYGVREVFKDDFKNILWQWIRKGKPKWAKTLIDPTSKTELAKQKIWLDYIKAGNLPVKTRQLLAKRNMQNKQSSEILHSRIETKVVRQGFQPGYDTLEETIDFSLLPFARYLERGSGKLYEQNEASSNKEKIKTTSIERRYQINVVIALDQGRYTEQFERYKITLNRSGIIAIEKAGKAAIEDKPESGRYSKLRTLLHFKKDR